MEKDQDTGQRKLGRNVCTRIYIYIKIWSEDSRCIWKDQNGDIPKIGEKVIKWMWCCDDVFVFVFACSAIFPPWSVWHCSHFTEQSGKDSHLFLGFLFLFFLSLSLFVIWGGVGVVIIVVFFGVYLLPLLFRTSNSTPIPHGLTPSIVYTLSLVWV